MAILQAVLALVFRSAGKLLNTAFGWATVMLFGRVPQDRQMYLSLVSFGSVIWLLALVGVAFPAAGTFLLSFVSLPQWVDRAWVRLGMLVAATIIPAAVGILAVRMADEPARPRGARGLVEAVLRGYPYTVGLALTLILMLVFAPTLKVRDLARRWETEHVPVIVEPVDYPAVVDDVQDALRAGGIETARGRASWMLRGPTRLLAWLAGPAVGELAAEGLTRLYAERVEILLHPSDLVISGRAADASRARAIIAEHLPFTRAYLTWDAEANEIEDGLRRVWRSIESGDGLDALARIRPLEARLHRLTLPYEEWEVLFRQKLQVERAALRRLAQLPDTPSTLEPDRRGIDLGALHRALAALADAADEFRKVWRAERRERDLVLLPILTAAGILAAVLARISKPRRPSRRDRFPAPDAHAEARFPRAA